MTFQQNRNAYVKKCESLSSHYLELALEFRNLAHSIKEYGVTEDIRQFIDKRIERLLK